MTEPVHTDGPLDPEYETHVITEVGGQELCDDNIPRFEVKFADGFCFLVRNPSHLPLPAVGETARLYGRGFGYSVRGFQVGDRVYFYETAAQMDDRYRTEQREREERALADWRRDLEGWKARAQMLPDPLRRRLDAFLARGGERWGAIHGGYELFCCEEAAAIAKALPTGDQVREFHGASIEKQKKLVPAVQMGEHSGNTFGLACRLAWLLGTNPELVVREHGAACPIVGCESYGCWASTEDAAKERDRKESR